MEISEDQRKVINQAIALLTSFNKEDVSYYTYYFKLKNEGGDEVGDDTCNKKSCIKKELKEIRSGALKGKHIIICCDPNDGDHDSIRRCSICGRPLNSSLTWIEDEFSHHRLNTTSKKDIIDSAFDLIAMLESVPSCDEYVDAIDIVKYAELIIEQLR